MKSRNDTAMRKKIEEVTRRINKLETELRYAELDVLKKRVPFLEERLDKVFMMTMMNSNEFSIFRNIVISIQQEMDSKK